MKIDIERLKQAFGASLKVGPVAVVDPSRGYRIKLGEGANGPFLSPWYPHPESGGENSSWVPLSVGQVVGMVNPNGDPRQGFLIRGGFSGQNPPIADDAEIVRFGFGPLTITAVDGGLIVDATSPVTINAPTVNLGGAGGQPVARVGDIVEIGAGSSAGQWPIVTGSPVVSAQ
ncbi:baseplate assembly protein [Pelagibacterium nitratireducens]|uniref:Baseplate assembly protein n=1 Tax=Pelagibacterium nitratireducens TaxID=1046114 RepID=A0ABZ2HYH3_9HYPH